MKKLLFSTLLFCLGFGAVYDEFGNYISEEELKKRQELELYKKSQLLTLQAAQSYIKRDYLDARRKYEEACEMGNALGCSGLGTIYERGLSVIKDLKTASAYYKKACDKKDAFGCFHFALINQGENAIELFKKECEQQDGESCYRLGALYYSGKSVPKDIESALKYFKRSCDFQNPLGCFNAGAIYEAGTDTIDPNSDLSLAYFQLTRRYLTQECKSGKSASCNLLNQGRYLNLLQ
ncbi:MAG: SEL1-like repeat protein [Helicobacter sp.]|nr:SEL1-like repeat protein [Helicobacter sp.]